MTHEYETCAYGFKVECPHVSSMRKSKGLGFQVVGANKGDIQERNKLITVGHSFQTCCCNKTILLKFKDHFLTMK